MQHMLLKDVSRQTYRWKVLVRLARIWDFRDQQTGTILYEVDFVAVDRQGGTMEGYIPNNRVEQFRDVLKEGSVYTIEQFVLSDAKKVYRSVEHPYRMRFTQRTKIIEIFAIPENFPMYAYSAKPFGVLATRMDDNSILSDFVGLVTIVTDVTVAPSTQQRKRQVFVTNGSERAVVTLWVALAEAFEADDIRLQSERHPMIVLFVGMTVSQFSGMLAFKSTSVTKWYMNVPIPEVAAIREIVKDQSYKVEEQGPSKSKGEPTDITLDVLANSSPYDRIGDRFKLDVQLNELVTRDNWWYLSCKSCWKKLQSDGEGFKCPRCSSIKGQPRYKITYAGTDFGEGTGDDLPIAHFTFLGQEGVSLLAKDEALLVPDARFPPLSVPSCLLEPIGKRYILTAELADNSLDSDYLCFQVNASEEVRTRLVQDEQPGNSFVPAVGGVSSSLVAETIAFPPVADGVSSVGDATPPEPSPAKTPVHTPSHDAADESVEKSRGSGLAKKREGTPPSRTSAKKGRGGRTAAKQLAFNDDPSVSDTARNPGS